MINIPSILDIGGANPDPTDEALTLSMVDYETLNVISNFTKRTNLGADLLMKENDEFIQGTEIHESEHSQNLSAHFGQLGASAGSTASKQNQQLTKRIESDDSAVSQLRKVIQSMHMNQRVVSAKISFK